MTGFSVDTKLFQELGELLVSKESTALVELIKNAYDADATLVTVTGTDLHDPAKGRILVNDDGVGMNSDEFSRGFLTIAGRTKNTGDRRSPVFGRRYTGEKGVGRLASHKLGTKVVVRSRKAGDAKRGAKVLPDAISEIDATINWSAIEALETFDQIDGSGAVTVTQTKPSNPASGTLLTISPLRSAWSSRVRSSFLREAATLAPASATWKPLAKGLAVEPLLFSQVPIRDQASGDPGFEVVFTGDLGLGDTLLPSVADAASWIAEIEFNHLTGLLRIAISPTAKAKREYVGAEGFTLNRDLGKNAGPSFRGRILQKERAAWDDEVRGIRIFMEGFRVSPYGDARDDWLGLEETYMNRGGRSLVSLSNLDRAVIPEGIANEELQFQGNKAYFGAIFLHRSTSQGLEMLINREGFLPSPAFDFIARWTRITTDLVVRLGAMARTEVKAPRREEREAQKRAAGRSDVNETPAALRVRENAVRVDAGIQDIKAALDRNDFAGAASAAQHLQPSLSEIREMADQFGGEAVQWRVLASLGAELAAFVHEINALGLEIAALLEDLGEAYELTTGSARSAIRRARNRATQLADRIKRNATYLVDATSFEGRRRRTRQPISSRFETVRLFFESRIEQKRITIENNLDPTLRTPPMFPSEVAGIFTNLLSNAVKFVDEGGRILVEAREEHGLFRVQMSNTGQAVDLRRAARLFEAFHSTTERPDAVLGQGMGMGLTITRAFIQEYGGEIQFVAPPAGFSSSIVFSIPTR